MIATLEIQQPRVEPVPAHGGEQGELHEHGRCGHHPKKGSCVTCAVASKRRRPHTQLNPLTAAGGELSVDLTGPHVSAHIPKDLAREPRGRYAVVAAYTPCRDAESLAALDGARAKQRWFRQHLPGDGGGDIAVDQHGGDELDVQTLESGGKPKTWVHVRIITGKASAETAAAILAIIDEINHSFRTQAVWSLHSDQGKEFLNQALGGREGARVALLVGAWLRSTQ